jgi:putative ABC transport system permease protein
MWTHALVTFYRSLTRHRLYSALNVLGLAVGVAVFLVLWLDVRFETNFEKWIPNAASIYVVRTVWQGPYVSSGANSSSMGGTLDELHEDYPQLVGTRIWGQSSAIREGAQTTPELVDVVDPTFFQTLDAPLIAGDKASLLSAPDDLVLSETKARRYFGAGNPIGQRLDIVFLGQSHSYRVTGVLKDLPANTNLQLDFLVPLTPQMQAVDPFWRSWGDEELTTLLRIDNPAARSVLNARLDGFVDRHGAHELKPPPAHKQLTLRVAPLLSMHLLDPKFAAVVAAIGAVGLLTLLLAGVNYINLATARAVLRAREVALRKVMGATSPVLIVQFMGEAFATAFLASLVGLALCELALPLINSAGGLSLKISYIQSDSILIPVIIATVLIALGAGIYPALVLSRFQPAAVLASARAPGGGRSGGRVREALVFVQFAIAIAFTIATAVIVNQTDYLRYADLGFERDGLVVVGSFNDSAITGAERASLLDAWRTLPGVASATAADIAPGMTNSVVNEITKRPGSQNNGANINYVTIQADFFRTYGARLIAGRFLDLAHGGDNALSAIWPTPPSSGPRVSRNVVADLTTLPLLGFKAPADALGKTILIDDNHGGFTPAVIVGVIENISFQPPHIPPSPTIYDLTTSDFGSQIAGIRYQDVAPTQLMQRMEVQWRRVAPSVPFRAITADYSLQRYYRADDQHGRLFVIGGVLAVLIGCVGLYGLASFNTARRVREIGIRKTLGASTRDILRLLILQFLRPVLLANLVAWPLAWVAMRGWLSTFDHRIDLGLGYFVGATVLTLLIAVGTVAGQALAVARSEPAKALRHE